MSAPEISIVIPARDAARTLPDTLAALDRQRGAPNHEVILVDDGSRDETASLAEAASIVDRVLRIQAAGPATARNVGAASAQGGKLAFLDADCVPVEGWLAAGAAALEDAELVLGETRTQSDRPRAAFDRTLEVTAGSPLWESANLFVRRELFEALGGFESWLRPWRGGKELGEDVWLGWRAIRAGARTTGSPQALVHHAVHRGTAAAYVAERARLRFFPALARRVPELRREFFHHRLFLNRRSERFDLAVAGLIAGAMGYRRAGLVAVLPYGRELVRDLREPDGIPKALVRPAADAVGLGALLLGSLRYRSPLF